MEELDLSYNCLSEMGGLAIGRALGKFLTIIFTGMQLRTFGIDTNVTFNFYT